MINENLLPVIRILEANHAIQAALLFGSQAMGTATPLSDIDVGILVNGELPLLDLGRLTAQIESISRRQAQVIILNDLYKRDPQMAFNVVSEGQVLFCRKPDSFVNFKRKTFLYYIDTLPLRISVNATLRQRIVSGLFGSRNYVG
jgi:predicted nucleotidyltransferase